MDESGGEQRRASFPHLSPPRPSLAGRVVRGEGEKCGRWTRAEGSSEGLASLTSRPSFLAPHLRVAPSLSVMASLISAIVFWFSSFLATAKTATICSFLNKTTVTSLLSSSPYFLRS